MSGARNIPGASAGSASSSAQSPDAALPAGSPMSISPEQVRRASLGARGSAPAAAAAAAAAAAGSAMLGSSAASMLQAAHSIAVEASSSADGLQSVSSALRGQAAAAAAAAAADAGEAMQRRASSSSQYAAAMSAQMSSALQVQQQQAQQQPYTAAQLGTGPVASSSALPAGAAELARPESPRTAKKQMGEIAVRAAAMEGESQLRMAAMLRNGSTPTPPAPISPSSLAARRASAGRAAAGSSSSSSSTPTKQLAVPTFLDQLGLSHIALPPASITQGWARGGGEGAPGKSQRPNQSTWWEQGDVRMGFSLAGVPSLPLMPTPPLQMLPPPTSPASLQPGGVAQPPRGGFTHFPFGASGGHPRGSPGDMSTMPYPFQVVQTPGGTARAGWWVPPEHVAPERRREAQRLSDGVATAVPFANRGEGTARADAAPDVASTPAPAAEPLPLFQPAYRFLQPDEYAVLASAAAYATAALTTTTSDGRPGGPSLRVDGGIPAQRPLTLQEQEEIAAQLRAWAGLEGPERQAEARQALEERQAELFAEQQQAAQPGSSEAGPSSGRRAQLFPPDFASHYRTQLRALAEGYYTRLHRDGLAQEHFAPRAAERAAVLSGGPSTSGALSSTLLAQEPGRASVYRRSEDQHTRAVSAPSTDPLHQPAPTAPAGHAPNEAAVPGPGGQDPLQLISAASAAAGTDVHSPAVRDQLLQYAHSLYSTGSTQRQAQPGEANPGQPSTVLHPTLLPLLHTLHKLHPEHLPTLLLLSCAYYTSGDLAASLHYNNRILGIDSNYVESMSNIGTTLRALGRWKEAESWWWRAVRLRPGYWDAYENLLGVLCSPQQAEPAPDAKAEDPAAAAATRGPRFSEALRLCEFVEAHVLTRRGDRDDSGRTHKVAGGGSHPQCMPPHLPTSHGPRLQNLFYAKGNLKYVVPDLGLVPAAREYQKAVEIVLSPSEQNAHSLRDLVVATCVVAILSRRTTFPGHAPEAVIEEVSRAIAMDPTDPVQVQHVASGSYAHLSSRGILGAVRNAGDRVVKTLLRLGNGQLPLLMLVPEVALDLARVIFRETNGMLPAIFASSQAQRHAPATQHQQALQQASQTTSTIILTLAKLFQDATANPASSSHGPLTLGGIPPSTSLLLPLYYLALSLHSSASTANNLGILLSSIPAVTQVVDAAGKVQSVNGQALAMQYYTRGLSLDARHPHLFTNLGSLLKDLGHLNEAISMYERAVDCNPTFDVALANLGNAIKDQGRTQDAVQYYRRAVEVNPRFPEALCGLVNALLAICDWREVYSEDSARPGWMSEVAALLTRQLEEGSIYGSGAMQSEGTLDDWVRMAMQATGDSRPETQEALQRRFAPFFGPLDRQQLKINEGSFVIRLIERLLRRSQRRWYLDAYQNAQPGSAAPAIIPTAADVARYPRLALPGCLIAPSVPTVLPFHTFTLKIPAQHIRLISHRNALRISQATLTQLWLPPHVYPPPPPPAPRLRIGYVSSDFNNHPLAHLMQSVFGMHDASRFDVFLYATTASDQSPYRQKIEREAQHFYDVSTWTNQQVIQRIAADGIHILMNLNGYTKGARNEIFAARPCPIQMQFMGFAGGLASGWTDWLVVDPIVCPPGSTSADLWRASRRAALESGEPLASRPTDFAGDLDPEDFDQEWMYSERCIYMPQSYFVCDHRQGFREPEVRAAVGDAATAVHPHEMSDEDAWAEEEERRWKARKELFPSLPDDFVVFCCFNQLYKLEPEVFKAWLAILRRVPNSIIWLLRFPAAGELHLLRAAREWAGDEVASRIVFTEVAPKGVHIHRGRIADLFLDAWECGAHTTSADILWSGTPVLTWPKHEYKLCSRVAASIVHATGYGEQMTVHSAEAYVERAVEFAEGIRHTYFDANGKRLEPVTPEQPVMASALEVNTASSAAQPHSSQAKPSKTDSSALAGSEPAAAASAAPAPANVKQAAAAAPHDAELAAVAPPRSEIALQRGPQAPPGSVTRRASGELAELRRKLFLTRDRHDGLFDTLAWTQALEKGYEEAWRRWVAGTDVEDTPEWEALPESAPEKRSGHIWL